MPGQTIAMFEQESYNPTDIATYQACYGTSVPISNVDVAGGPTPVGDDGESALDIEQAIGLAPKASILVYQGPFTTATVPDHLHDRLAERGQGDLELVGRVRGADRRHPDQRRDPASARGRRAGPVVLHLLGRQRLEHVLPGHCRLAVAGHLAVGHRSGRAAVRDRGRRHHSVHQQRPRGELPVLLHAWRHAGRGGLERPVEHRPAGRRQTAAGAAAASPSSSRCPRISRRLPAA